MIEWFRSLLEAKVIIQDWWRHYNEIRPHSGLNCRTPAEFIADLRSNFSTACPVDRGHEVFWLGVLALELTELARFRDICAAELGLPLLEPGIAESAFAADILDGHTGLSL